MGWRACQYPHQESMPYAREPLKTLYVSQRLFTTLALVPLWALYYLLIPRTRRPRPSWSIKQIVAVNFMRRVYKVTELAGVTWYTRDPDEACDDRTLKETRFEWAEPLPKELRTGILVDDHVPFKPVGMFVWPKIKPRLPPYCDEVATSALDGSADVLNHVEEGKVPVIGIFLHGGGYCHMSAHEKCSTSKIPRRLMKDKAFDEIYAVEYRLLQHAPFPAAVQDAAAVYTSVLRRYQPRSPSHSPESQSKDSLAEDKSDGGDLNDDTDTHANVGYLNQHRTHTEKSPHVHTSPVPLTKHCKIVLIGDSAGGNLVLALARWIRDEDTLPPPDGLLLLSPSCDPSHAFPDSPSAYIPRPHASTDYLVDTPEPRALLQRTFLGHNPLETMHSPYVSPASHKVLRAFYGELFAAGVEGLTIAALDADAQAYIRAMGPSPTSVPMPVPVAAPPTPVTPGTVQSPTSLAHPVFAAPRGLGLFGAFPRACVVLGDAERLEREVVKLVSAMERDAVPVDTVWVRDGPHDVLMMGWWDEKVRDAVWRRVVDWVGEVARS